MIWGSPDARFLEKIEECGTFGDGRGAICGIAVAANRGGVGLAVAAVDAGIGWYLLLEGVEGMSEARISFLINGHEFFSTSPLKLMEKLMMMGSGVRLEYGARVECVFENGAGHISRSAEYFEVADDE